MSRADLLRRLGPRPRPLDAVGNASIDGATTGGLVAAATLKALAADGLVDLTKQHVQRTSAGSAYLKRALASAADEPFATQHRTIVAETRTSEAVTVLANAKESPLAWLATRRDRSGRPMLEREHVLAGRRLAEDHDRGHQRERVTQSWDASGVRGDAPRDRLSVSEAAADARRRVERAVEAVGPGLANVLVAVCCEEQGLEAVEKRYGWPARCGKVILRLALDRLAAHYGLGAAAHGAPATHLLHWGTADYRPAA